MAIEKVAVIGAGTMGNGIAQVFAAKGFSVTMIDIKEEFVQKGVAAIDKSLSRLAATRLHIRDHHALHVGHGQHGLEIVSAAGPHADHA